jgi:general secretion pathway protein F
MSASYPSVDSHHPRLSDRDAEKLAVYVAELSTAGLPLPAGLRAAASEVGGRLATPLNAMADALDRGEPLEQVLQKRNWGFPQYLDELVYAALQTGRIGEALLDLIQHRRAARRQREAVALAIAYPILLLALTLLLYVAMAVFLAPVLRTLLTDFSFTLPVASSWLVFVGEWGPTVIVVSLVLVVITALTIRLAFGAAVWRRLIGALPLIGGLWHWSAVAEMFRLAATLVRHRVPLPEALRLTGASLRDANLALACHELAAGVEEGGDLGSLIVISSRIPVSAGPIVRWGSRTGKLDEAFLCVAEMFEGRVKLRAALLKSVLPPFVFIAVATLALALFIGFFGPVVLMLQNLV